MNHNSSVNIFFQPQIFDLILLCTYILLFTVLSALIFKLVNCLVIFYIELVKVEITRFVQLVILRLLLILPIHVDFTSCKVDISNMICEHQIDRLEILNSAETRVLDNQV